MVKITEYAASHGCTPQNVYLHLRKPEFKGHWSKGTLDDEAVAMLDKLITPANGIVVVDREHQEQIDQLKAEITRLHNELERSQDQLIQAKDLLLEKTEQIGQLQIANTTMMLQIEAQEAKKKPFWRRK